MGTYNLKGKVEAQKSKGIRALWSFREELLNCRGKGRMWRQGKGESDKCSGTVVTEKQVPTLGGN